MFAAMATRIEKTLSTRLRIACVCSMSSRACGRFRKGLETDRTLETPRPALWRASGLPGSPGDKDVTDIPLIAGASTSKQEQSCGGFVRPGASHSQAVA